LQLSGKSCSCKRDMQDVMRKTCNPDLKTHANAMSLELHCSRFSFRGCPSIRAPTANAESTRVHNHTATNRQTQ
jgi:hypothetical protein